MEAYQEVKAELDLFEELFKPDDHMRCVAANAILLRFDMAIAEIDQGTSSAYESLRDVLKRYEDGIINAGRARNDITQKRKTAKIILERNGYSFDCMTNQQEINAYFISMDGELEEFNRQTRLQPAEETR